MNRLKLTNVGFTWPGADTPLFAGVSATLSTGQLIALYGANGSGKSTLARLAAGLLTPTEGKVEHSGHDGWNRVALVMQEPSAQLLCGTVAEEIAWGLENLNLPTAEIVRRVEDALKRFGLENLRDVPPEQLSDGQRQQTAIASVMVMQPEFIIFDEATAFLDPFWRKQLWANAIAAKKTCGVLWVTARPDEAEKCDLIWLVEDRTVKTSWRGDFSRP